ncbi:MAG: PD40 domain-containing protein [Leptospiraceae bacterium]|nr:PD40 domain-containing protein [Leptospiraceae bacterium]
MSTYNNVSAAFPVKKKFFSRLHIRQNTLPDLKTMQIFFNKLDFTVLQTRYTVLLWLVALTICTTVIFAEGPKAVKVFGDYGKIQTLAISEDGKVLAFSSDYRDGKGDIIVYDIEKNIKKILTRSNALDSQPVFSPDGNYIYYFSNEQDQGGIWKMPRSGGNPERVTEEKYWCEFPALSSDGKTLVYYSRRAGSYNLYEIDLATRIEKKITDGSAFDFGPVFIKNNRSIVFYSNRKDTFSLYELNRSTGKINELNGPGGFTFQPSTDSEGKFIFSVSNKRGNNDIYQVFLNSTSEPKLITPEKAHDLFPVNDAKRRTLYFISQREGDFGIYKLQY